MSALPLPNSVQNIVDGFMVDRWQKSEADKIRESFLKDNPQFREPGQVILWEKYLLGFSVLFFGFAMLKK